MGWKGRESVIQGPASSPPPTLPNQTTPQDRQTPEIQPPGAQPNPEAMERDNSLHGSRHATQGGEAETEREDRAQGGPLPPPPPPPPAPVSDRQSGSLPFSEEDIERQRASMEQLIKEAQAAETNDEEMLDTEHQGAQRHH